ncbi:hypothetical protein [Candidatus Competibacter phosphatis]|uniref:hypothetical protein n=1 Tax=Candidatus Competibacter phosphatis TaxID=221280 RepID=UPI00145DC727|nr:hypothetical protein [Candidatus Competibacter phosphatis]
MNRHIDPRFNALWHLGIGKQNAMIKTLYYFFYIALFFILKIFNKTQIGQVVAAKAP